MLIYFTAAFWWSYILMLFVFDIIPIATILHINQKSFTVRKTDPLEEERVVTATNNSVLEDNSVDTSTEESRFDDSLVSSLYSRQSSQSLNAKFTNTSNSCKSSLLSLNRAHSIEHKNESLTDSQEFKAMEDSIKSGEV